MADIDVTPQPEGKPENQPEGPESTPPESFSLGGAPATEQKSDTKPVDLGKSLLEPSPEGQSNESQPSSFEQQTNPAQLAVPSPAEEVAEPEAPSGEEPQKKGLPKGLLIGLGVVAAVAIAGAGMFFSGNWPFQAQLRDVIETTAVDTQEFRLAAPQYCPDGQYYPGEQAARTFEEQTLRTLDTSVTTTSRLLNAVPSAHAQETRVAPADTMIITTDAVPFTSIDQPIEAEMTTIDGASLMIDQPVLEAEMATTDAAVPSLMIDQPVLEAEMTTTEEQAPIRMETAVMEELPSLTMEMTTQETQDPIRVLTATQETVSSLTTRTAVPEFETSQCRTIDFQDCELVGRLLADAKTYRLSPATVTRLEVADTQCKRVVTEIPDSCTGDNMERAVTGECVCSEGFLKLDAPTDVARIAALPFVCIDCAELTSRIDTLKTRQSSLDALDITAEEKERQSAILQTEIDRLEAKSTEECLTTRREPPEITVFEEPTRTCDELIREISLLRAAPTARTTPEISQELARLTRQAESQSCDIPEEQNECERLAEDAANQISRGDFRTSYSDQVAYINAACIGELDPCDQKIASATVAKEYRNIAENSDQAQFFRTEFETRRDAYMNDLSCVPNKQRRCEEIETSRARTVETETEPTLLTLVDEPVRDEAVFVREANLLSQVNLDAEIRSNIEMQSVLTDDEYYNLYCRPYEPPETRDVTPIPEISERPPVTTETPPVSIEPPVTVTPVVLTPPEELEAAAPEEEFVAPAAPAAPVVTEETAIEVPELRPGAPEPVEEMPPITEAPEITKTGPESYIFLFLILASQIFIFRRRIYAFIENRK